jgi:hypothetical protein
MPQLCSPWEKIRLSPFHSGSSPVSRTMICFEVQAGFPFLPEVPFQRFRELVEHWKWIDWPSPSPSGDRHEGSSTGSTRSAPARKITGSASASAAPRLAILGFECPWQG